MSSFSPESSPAGSPVEESEELSVSDGRLPPPLGDIAAMTTESRLSRTRRKRRISRRRQGGAGPISARPRHARPSPAEVIVGRFVGLSGLGEPLISHPLSPGDTPVPARSTIAFLKGDLGCEVVVAFEAGDPRRPIVTGILRRPGEHEMPEPRRPVVRATTVEVSTDRDRIVLSAEQEIVLQCGPASITLTRAGKILIRGAYLLSQASGVNRIRGGSIQLN